jgi:RNA polymerase sigma factor (sigma-70 family)
MDSNLSCMIIKLLIDNEPMELKNIIKEIQRIDQNIKYNNIYNIIKYNINKKDSPLFKCIDNKLYTITDRNMVQNYYRVKTKQRTIKQRLPINGMKVSNNTPIFHKESEEKILEVEKHFPFLKQIAIKAASTFGLDSKDIFHELIQLSYEHKDKYDPKKSKPTTFINSQITPRLYNRIKRELLPNFYKVVKDEDGNKEGKRFLVKEKSLYVPIKNNKTDDFYLIDSITHQEVNDSYGYENDKDFDISSSVENRNIEDQIKESLSLLDNNEFLVISKKFGLDGKGEKTLEQVGNDDEVKLTKERVRQILLNGIKKLKNKPILREIYSNLA